MKVVFGCCSHLYKTYIYFNPLYLAQPSFSFNGHMKDETLTCQFEKVMFSIKAVVVMKTMKSVVCLSTPPFCL